MGHHGGPNHRDLGPIRVHLGVEVEVVVKDIVPVDSTVVHFVLEESQQQMIADAVFARRRLRSGDQKDPILCSGGERRVKPEPLISLLVPVLEQFLDGVTQFRVIVEGSIRRVGHNVGDGCDV